MILKLLCSRSYKLQFSDLFNFLAQFYERLMEEKIWAW